MICTTVKRSPSLSVSNFIVRNISTEALRQNVFRKEPGGAWGTPYDGLCPKAPPDKGNFFRVQTNERVENQRNLQRTSYMLADNCLICRLGAQRMIFKSNVNITAPDLPSPLASLFRAADAYPVTWSEQRS